MEVDIVDLGVGRVHAPVVRIVNRRLDCGTLIPRQDVGSHVHHNETNLIFGDILFGKAFVIKLTTSNFKFDVVELVCSIIACNKKRIKTDWA